jgi:hypothetical protein
MKVMKIKRSSVVYQNCNWTITHKAQLSERDVMNKGLNCVQVPKTPPVGLIIVGVECVVNCYTEKYLQETIIMREKAEIRASHEHPIEN